MKIELCIGFLCITAIIVTGLGMGYNGVLAGGGVSAIVAVLTWQGKKQVDKKGGNVAAARAVLKKAGYDDEFISCIEKKLKGGE